MTDDPITDLLIGVPLQMALTEFESGFRAKAIKSAALWQNTTSGGTITVSTNPSEQLADRLHNSNFFYWCTLSSYDLPAIRSTLKSTMKLAALTDYILHEEQARVSQLFHLHLADALDSAARALAKGLEDIRDELTAKTEDGMLKGSLQKCLNYMGIIFGQHHYEFLNIAYNMGTHEYEMLTTAEVDKMKTLNKWGDRRLVLTCSIYELEKLTTCPQLKLELPDAGTHSQETSEDRERNIRVDPTGDPRSDAAEAGRPDNDGTITGPQSNHVESADSTSEES